MTIATLTEFFGWCSVINLCILLTSTVAIYAGRNAIPKIHARMFGLDESTLSAAYFQYLAQYKIVTLTMNVAPYVALKLIASTAA